MENITEERIELIYKILDKKKTWKEAEKELDELEKKYGEKAFLSYQLNKQPKPWNEEYLQQLEALARAGAASREFISHLAEVSEEVRKRRKLIKSGIASAFMCVIVIISLLLWVLFFRGGN